MLPSTSLVSLVISLTLDHASAHVTINTATKYQTIDGFGFFEAFGFGVAVQDAPTTQQNQALTYPFDETDSAFWEIGLRRIRSIFITRSFVAICQRW